METNPWDAFRNVLCLEFFQPAFIEQTQGNLIQSKKAPKKHQKLVLTR